MAGADANPYLVLAAVLGGALDGLDAGQEPATSPLAPGEASSARHLTHDWLNAIERASSSVFLEALLGERFLGAYTAIKRHEALDFNRRVTETDWQACLARV